MTIGSVVIDCSDFETMSRFWQEALRYVPREAPGDGWVVLRDPKGPNVNVSLNRVREPRAGKNRLHLDLYSEDPEGDAERLVDLGAVRHPRAAEPGEDFVVLQDPEGNLFCVIDQSATG